MERNRVEEKREKLIQMLREHDCAQPEMLKRAAEAQEWELDASTKLINDLNKMLEDRREMVRRTIRMAVLRSVEYEN
jgi:hypothetical protein